MEALQIGCMKRGVNGFTDYPWALDGRGAQPKSIVSASKRDFFCRKECLRVETARGETDDLMPFDRVRLTACRKLSDR